MAKIVPIFDKVLDFGNYTTIFIKRAVLYYQHRKEVNTLSRKSEDCVKLTEESYYGTRMQAIRKKCIDCCGGDRNEVKNCHIKNCPLWVFRLAKKVTKQDCDEQKEYIAKVGDQLWH